MELIWKSVNTISLVYFELVWNIIIAYYYYTFDGPWWRETTHQPEKEEEKQQQQQWWSMVELVSNYLQAQQQEKVLEVQVESVCAEACM